MSSNLFNTKEKQQAAKANFIQLKSVAGWNLITQMLQEDVDSLKKQIIAGGLPEDELDRMRDAVRVYESVINAPDNWVKRFEEGAVFQETTDPYFTVESLKEERRKAQASRQDTK